MKRSWMNICCLAVAAFGLSLSSAWGAEDDWTPVPLEELERASMPSSAPKTQPATAKPAPETQADTPTVLPEADSPPAVAPAPPRERPGLTSEEIQRRLRSNHPAPVVLPRGWKAKRKKGKSIAGEGAVVAGRIGRVTKGRSDAWYVVTFENNRYLPTQLPRRLLPCRLLEEVEAYLKKTPHPDVRFRFSGESTRAGRQSYLLLHRVAIVEGNVTDVEPEAAPGGEPAKPATSSATQPASQPSGEDSASSLIQKMLQDQPGRAVRVPPAPRRHAGENVQSVAPAGRRPFTPGKRHLVVDRIVRIINDPDNEWWEARFESDNTLREPPVRILPGLRLEWIKKTMTKSGKTDMRLRVSGDVTYYKGKRYLMLRKVLRQRDMDQF